ncbi:hypothetical protein [Saccharospirillum salsuginis]|uniref:Uncharacterized protein n=1 Tax=Saccharospirillum salsuginis TaxID=418750 RepID=A0A918KA20_9GAMM|nr:hypothetical protein [Saccharospirillum salsuginis]GGX55511.1 hypothetical protein GCM10007392_24000 [Saccharospirillum salsuginis]
MAQITEIPMNGFTIQDAVTYLNYPVADKSKPASERYQLMELGLIVGVLTLNDEVELVIKIGGGVEQYTRHEFSAKFEVVDD